MFRVIASMNRRTILREILTFLGFLTLTVIMTWPWVLHLHDAVSDRGDPYAIAYWLWWDYHQTFHDPLNLFQATIFYPYKYTLAFAENAYGVSLLFFPLFALGFRPLTVLSLATLTAFVISGYGMFRLVRTLTNSVGAAWIAGIVFAFIPYHFQRLPHLNLLFTGWIPLMLEALVLFARERKWRWGIWLGFTFLMNALVCVSWFILTLVPLVLSGVFLVAWWRLLRDRKLWIRGGLPVAIASLLIIGFLYAYYRVNQLYGFARSPAQVLGLSAYPIHWLAASERNKLWRGLGGKAAIDELMIFPGFLPPLLGLAAFLLVKPISGLKKIRFFVSRRAVVILLDSLALLLLFITLLTIGYSGIHLNLFGVELLKSTHAIRPFTFFLATVCFRVLLARPQIIYRLQESDFIANVRSDPRSIAFGLGIIWLLIGVLGSFGMNLFFHRMLFEVLPIFKSLRAPARWAMIAYVGLSIFAGIGAQQIARLLVRWRPSLSRALIYGVIAVLILFEQRVAPLEFVRGEVDPDAMTLRLKETPMSGGIVELPAIRDNYAYFRYMLRAADHGWPIVTAAGSFAPPILQEIESLTKTRPIPERFIDLLEEIPTSYLVVHNDLLSPENRSAIELVLQSGMAKGRLRLIHRDGQSSTGDELYAVTKTEPGAVPDPNPVDDTRFFVRQQYLDLLGREPDKMESDNLTLFVDKCNGDSGCLANQRSQAALEILRLPQFNETGFFLYHLYRLALQRNPTYQEWTNGIRQLTSSSATSKRSFAEELIATPEFRDHYSNKLSDNGYVNKLLRTFRVRPADLKHEALVQGLKNGVTTRAEVLLKVADSSSASEAEYRKAFVTICYFIYLKRDPDVQGYNYWLQSLRDTSNDMSAVVRGFVSSAEYRSRFGQP
jgi:hypothetical protein